MAQRTPHFRLGDPLLTVPQFTAEDARRVSGLTTGQFKGIIDRQQVMLTSNHNPGTGRRRMYSGLDILSLSALREANRIGFPLRWGVALSIYVTGHARRMRTESQLGIETPAFKLAFYPAEDSEEWAFVQYENQPPEDILPAAHLKLDVSKITKQVFAKLEAVIADEEIPTFLPPQPPDQQALDEASFPFEFETHADGKRTILGLTPQETALLLSGGGQGPEARDEYLAAYEKYEAALMARGRDANH